MATHNREEKYTGHQNKEIKALLNARTEAEKEIRRIDGDVLELREKCDHEFVFWCSGMYEDFFYCKLCGQEDEN